MINPRDFTLLALSAFGRKVFGDMSLRAYVYFLAVMTGMKKGFRYRAEYYGPYSPTVVDGVNKLKALGYLHCTNGSEVRRYKLKLSKDGKRLAARKKTEYPNEWAKIEKAAAIIKKAGNLDWMQLAAASKAHFVLGKTSEKRVECLIARFPWSYRRKGYKGSPVKFLKEIGLVKRKKKSANAKTKKRRKKDADV